MSRTQRWFVALAVFHLIMVSLGAMGIDFRGAIIPPARALGLYGALTGANNRYGFFAPEVQTPTRVSFTMTGTNGETWDDTLAIGRSSEANLRLGTIAFMLPAMSEEDQDKMMRSFAASMFGRHPAAETVELHFEMFGVRQGEEVQEFPAMSKFADGQRPEWIRIMTTPPYRRGRLPLR